MARDFTDMIKIKDLEEERAPSFIQVVPFKSYALQKMRVLPRYSQERDIRMENYQKNDSWRRALCPLDGSIR